MTAEPAPDIPPEWFRQALDTMLDLVVIQRAIRDERGTIVDFEIEYANRATPDIAQRTGVDLTGRRLRDLYPSVEPLVEQFARVVETGEPLSVDAMPYEDVIEGRPVSGFWSLRGVKFGDGALVVARDVTPDVIAQAETESTNRRFEAAQALAHIGLFSIELNTGEVWFSGELRRIFGLEPDSAVPDPEQLRRTLFGVDEQVLFDADGRAVGSTGPTTFETILHLPDAPSRVLLVHIEREIEGRELRTVWGTAQDVTALRHAQDDLHEAHATLRDQRALIDQFQTATLAPVPNVKGLDLEAAYYPATGLGFGGDWYDAFDIDAGRVALVVGDIAGHDLDAVATMAQFRNALRAYAYTDPSPAAVLGALNEFALRNSKYGIGTVLYGLYDLAANTVCWAHAGHMPPIHLASGGALLVERPGRPPLGMDTGEQPTPEHVIALEPGERLILYTDGLVERRGELIDVGLERLRRAASGLADRPGPIAHRLRRWLTLAEHGDDICLLVARRTPPTG